MLHFSSLFFLIDVMISVSKMCVTELAALQTWRDRRCDCIISLLYSDVVNTFIDYTNSTTADVVNTSYWIQTLDI